MGESKIPFKSNVKRPIRKKKMGPSSMAGKNRRSAGGFGIPSKKNRPLRITVVNEKQERIRNIKWILKWVLVIPLGILALVWLLIVLADVFTYLTL